MYNYVDPKLQIIFGMCLHKDRFQHYTKTISSVPSTNLIRDQGMKLVQTNVN